MKKELYEIWKVQEGSKTLWLVQCPKGRLTFQRKKDAEHFAEGMKSLEETKKRIENL